MPKNCIIEAKNGGKRRAGRGKSKTVSVLVSIRQGYIIYIAISLLYLPHQPIIPWTDSGLPRHCRVFYYITIRQNRETRNKVQAPFSQQKTDG